MKSFDRDDFAHGGDVIGVVSPFKPVYADDTIDGGVFDGMIRDRFTASGILTSTSIERDETQP